MEVNGTITTETQLLTIDQAAEYLGYKKKYLYNLTSARAIPFVKCGPRRVRFRLADLRDWMDKQITVIPTNAQVKESAARYCLNNPKA